MSSKNVTFPFLIDNEFVPVFIGKILPHWYASAEAKGFSIIGRAVDRLNVVLGCKTCGNATLKRINVLTGSNPECPHCILNRRKMAAREVGARLLGTDPKNNRHYGIYELACGHTDRRQHHRVETAAAGGHKLSCNVCLVERHTAEAEANDWCLIGPAERNNKNFRSYEHSCGHRQDVTIGNMRARDVNCAGCGETWSSKPSQIYLLNFVLPSLPIIKLGFSNNPLIRLGQVQFKPQETKGAIVRTIDMETGHRAICIEKALHTHIKAHRPDLIVPFGLFRSHIRTKSEIYYAHGRDYISKLLTAANAGWDPNHTTDWQGFITA